MDIIKDKIDLVVFSALLFICNLHLFGFGSVADYIYIPSKVVSGEVYRLVTSTFTHVSIYHLVLDGSAFLFLYTAIRKNGLSEAVCYTVSTAAMSLLFAGSFDPIVKTIGFCGLSGVGHGLFAILSLMMIKDDTTHFSGWLLFFALFGKTLVEVAGPVSVFDHVHGNMVGTPILISHLGGIVGGVFSYYLVGSVKKKKNIASVVLTLFIFLSCLATPFESSAATEKRTALVIGNSLYSEAMLKNPENDASDIAVSLRSLGFDVILKTNVNQRSMESSIRAFGDRLSNGGVGLFYYAGHAVQINGTNYLIPVDSVIEKESDIRYEAVNVKRVFSEMRLAANPLNILILDSCRDNPYAGKYRSTSSLYRGLARMDAPKGTLIAYSTSPGHVASDGKGRNSPYTSLLLNHMDEKNVPVEKVFKKVRKAIDRQTDGRQIPWESTSLTGDFYFNPAQYKDNDHGNISVRAGITPPVVAGVPVQVLPLPTGELVKKDIEKQSNDESYLTIHVVNNTGHTIPFFQLKTGETYLIDAIDDKTIGSQKKFTFKKSVSGNYIFSVEAKYGFKVDDLETRRPSVSAESRLFAFDEKLWIDDNNQEVWVTISFKNSGFWETRKKEELVIDISD